jgi:hypothetical protein
VLFDVQLDEPPLEQIDAPLVEPFDETYNETLDESLDVR